MPWNLTANYLSLTWYAECMASCQVYITFSFPSMVAYHALGIAYRGHLILYNPDMFIMCMSHLEDRYITFSISHGFSERTHNSHPIARPITATYGVSFVSSGSGLYSTFVAIELLAISGYSRPRYIEIQLYVNTNLPGTNEPAHIKPKQPLWDGLVPNGEK